MSDLEVYKILKSAILIPAQHQKPPVMVLEYLNDKLAFLLKEWNGDTLLHRKDRRKRSYSEKGLGQFYLERVGGIREMGEALMQKELERFKRHGKDERFTIIAQKKPAETQKQNVAQASKS
jgi:predicted GNAT family N-acyltransferase